MFQRFSAFLVFAVLPIVLAGCNSRVDPLCPSAAALVETSSLTGFAQGATQDPSHALYRVVVRNVTTDCSIDRSERTATSSLDIHFLATRTPTGEAAHYRVPYFVAVRQGADIQAKRVFWVDFTFDPNAATATFDETIDSTVIKIANDKQPYDYQILVGLQLTKEQLLYNRRIGHYGP